MSTTILITGASSVATVELDAVLILCGHDEIQDDGPLDRLVGHVRLNTGVVVGDVEGAPDGRWRALSASLPRQAARQ